MIIDIVLLPPEAVCEKMGKTMIGLQQNLSFNFIVDNSKLKPHISLLHLKTREGNLNKLIAAVGKIALEHKPIKFLKPGFHKGRRFLAAFFSASKSLYSLHEKVVKNISVFKNGSVGLPFGLKTPLEKKYLEMYGAGNILHFYHPHITLGWVKREADMDKAIELVASAKLKSFAASRLAVAEVNQNYQAVKILKEFRLK